MTARGRALAILTGLVVFVAGWVVFVSHWSGPVGQGAGVAGAHAADLDAFRNELLVWAPGGFSEREVGKVRDSTRVAAISAVRAGLLPAASGRRGYGVVPVEVMAVDANAYTTAAGRPGRKLVNMLPKGAVLSRTGAKLRKVKSGGRLRLAGHHTVSVGGVVDDALLGGYEVAMDRDLARRYGIRHTAYLLVKPRGPVDGLKRELRRLLKGRTLQFLTPGDRPFVRGGDGVLPLAQVRRLPVLGWVRCHRLVIGDLGKAMADIQHQGLRGLVDVGAFRRDGGCWSTRLLRDARGGKLSRHAWGIAVELPVTPNDRVIRIMARHGFLWGGNFAHPDDTHFEWVGRGA